MTSSLASTSAFVLTAALLAAAPAAAQTAKPEEIVDAMRALSGNQKARASGAKGQCVAGTFTPTAGARKLSKSALFNGPSKVLARFSVGGGNPKAPDAIKTASRGLAIRLGDGTKGRTEFVAVNAPVHFARTPDQMLAFVQARSAGADGKPDPAKIKAFSDANPETTNQGKYIAARPVPASWVGVSYWAVHGYTLTSAKGARQLVKFKFVPTGGETGLTDDEAKAKPNDFLVAELEGRLAVKAATSFDPSALADGIAGPKGEPLFTARKPAYGASLAKRS